MALIRKKVKGKEYLYEVSYVRENGKLKQKWKLIGRVTNSISNSPGRERGTVDPLVAGSNPAAGTYFSKNNQNRAFPVTNTLGLGVTNTLNNFCNPIHEYGNDFKKLKFVFCSAASLISL